MRTESKTVVYDKELRVEAYRFVGMRHPFPNHFHEHYVIGLVESGQRVLSCKNKEYVIKKGSMLLFNPGDNHACVQSDGGNFDYRGMNIEEEVMLDFAEEVTGQRKLPVFGENVIGDNEAVCCLRRLHEMVMREIDDLGKEETMLLFLSMLFQNYGQAFDAGIFECGEEINNACAY
ncbi:MAG: AraC family ligand binding domain-containing protein, partial [Lachnospiraceae bacterium]|nr:AraC family ligand binding domain-containing protein [Lachnospiraceae bacterium]